MSEFKSPLISVVIPNHNNSGFLIECIESVLNQTYSNTEVIFIDDGSTDKSLQILLPYQDRIKLIATRNRGAAAARNTGILNALGEFIAFLEKSNVMTDERRLKGATNQWLSRAIDDGQMELVGGEKIGIRTKSGKAIGLEDIMEEKYLDLAGDCYGVLIPGADVLRRTKYQWFAVMSHEELLGTNIAIVRYMKASMIDANDEYYRTNEIKSVVSL